MKQNKPKPLPDLVASLREQCATAKANGRVVQKHLGRRGNDTDSYVVSVRNVDLARLLDECERLAALERTA